MLELEGVFFDDPASPHPEPKTDLPSQETHLGEGDPRDVLPPYEPLPRRPLTPHSPSGKGKAATEAESLNMAKAEHAGLALRLREHTAGVTVLAVSPDGRWIAGGTNDSAVAVWDASSGECAEVRTVGGAVASLVFAGDSARYAVGAGETATVFLVQTPESAVVLPGAVQTIVCPAFHPADSTRLATAGPDNSVVLWDAACGARVRTYAGHSALVSALAFSHDGARLLSGGVDERVVVWDVASGAVLHDVAGHDSVIWAVAASADGRRYVSCTDDGAARVFSARTGAVLAVLGACAGPVWAVRFSPSGAHVLALASDSSARVYDSWTGELLFDVPSDGAAEQARGAAFSPDGQWLAARAGSTAIKVWNAAEKRLVRTLELPVENLNAIMFMPDSQGLVSSVGDDQIILWTAVTDET